VNTQLYFEKLYYWRLLQEVDLALLAKIGQNSNKKIETDIIRGYGDRRQNFEKRYGALHSLMTCAKLFYIDTKNVLILTLTAQGWPVMWHFLKCVAMQGTGGEY